MEPLRKPPAKAFRNHSFIGNNSPTDSLLTSSSFAAIKTETYDEDDSVENMKEEVTLAGMITVTNLDGADSFLSDDFSQIFELDEN